MDTSERRNPFDEFIVSSDTNNSNNNSSIKVETVTSSSQVSPILPNESVMDLIWSQTLTNEPSITFPSELKFDWKNYGRQNNNVEQVQSPNPLSSSNGIDRKSSDNNVANLLGIQGNNMVNRRMKIHYYHLYYPLIIH